MSKKLSITHVSGKASALSKEQKRFNTYITKVKTLKTKVEDMKVLNRELYQIGEDKIKPLLTREADAFRTLVLAIDRSSFWGDLSANKRKKLRQIVLELVEPLISEHGMDDLIPIYDKNADKGEDYAEMARQQEEMEKAMTKKMMEMMFGLEVEDEDLKDPGTFQEKMQEKFEQKQAEETEREANRKKTAKQQAKEERENEAERKLTQSSKQIYLQLAKAFHPDTAENEEEEKRRTEILQEVNAAYEANDLMKLLEMQITLMEGKEEQLSKMGDDKLSPYNKILKRQIDELEMQLQQLNPQFNGHPYASIYHTHKGSQTRKINLVISEYKDTISQLTNTVESIGTLKGFKNFIANYEFEEEEMDFSDMFSFL
jgi:chemotaxis protein histidine kinase CheA